jgi:hypothetical protein
VSNTVLELPKTNVVADAKLFPRCACSALVSPIPTALLIGVAAFVLPVESNIF